MSDSLLKKSSYDSFKINRRSVSTQLMTRTALNGQGESFVNQILLNRKRRSLMLLKKTTEMEPHPSNLIPRPVNSMMRRRRSHSSGEITVPNKVFSFKKPSETLYGGKRELVDGLKRKRMRRTANGDYQAELINHIADCKMPIKKSNHSRRGSLAHKVSSMTQNNFSNQNQSRPSPSQLQQQTYTSAVQLRQTRDIDGYIFLVIIRLDSKGLLIRAYPKDNFLQPRVIEVQREDALFFIKQFCQNRIERIYDRLHSDGNYIYLMANQEEKKRGREGEGQVIQEEVEWQ